MWTIGIHILSQLFDAMPAITNSEWISTGTDINNSIKTAMVWVIPILVLFGSIKVLSLSSSRDDY